jgi:hypothetical protein
MDNETRLIAATDGLGRKFGPVGGEKADRYVGIFYFLWLGQHLTDKSGIFDNTKLLETNPEALWDTNPNDASPEGEFHFWGEPLFGYYNSSDEWVMRRHIKMLTAAGVDFFVFDTTNAFSYDNVWEKLFAILDEYRVQGFTVPKVAFYTNSESGKTIKHLYDVLYSPGRYRELWFTHGGKPLIIGTASEVTPELLDFFWFRPSQWPNEPDRDGGFPWIDWHRPQKLYGDVMSVSVAQHPGLPFSDSVQFKAHDGNWGRGYHNGKNDTNAIESGANFEEQWRRALECDPELVFVTGWNEWIATKFVGDPGNIYGKRAFFVDCADEEFSRDAEPMRSGYGDNYYLQLAKFIREYKGMPLGSEKFRTVKTIDIGGSLSQWDGVSTVYRGYGDRTPRDFIGYTPKIHYKAEAPRNAVRELRVADDIESLYFYIHTVKKIEFTPGEHNNINIYLAPIGGGTGFGGFDFVVGRDIIESGAISVDKLAEKTDASRIGEAKFSVCSEVLQVKIPREMVGLCKNDGFIFKIAYGVEHPDDIVDYYVSGDSLPIGRLGFAYGV